MDNEALSSDREASAPEKIESNVSDVSGTIPGDLVSEILQDEFESHQNFQAGETVEDEEEDLDMEDLLAARESTVDLDKRAQDLTQIDSSMLAETFAEMDSDEDGEISRSLVQNVNACPFRIMFSYLFCREEFLLASGVNWDVDHDGKIWIQEFDQDNDGVISAQEVHT